MCGKHPYVNHGPERRRSRPETKGEENHLRQLFSCCGNVAASISLTTIGEETRPRRRIRRRMVLPPF